MATATTLENCDREPIHIPGSIQPHGALLAFDAQGRLSHVSANTPQLLGVSLPFGEPAATTLFAGHPTLLAEVEAAIADSLSDEVVSTSGEAVLNGQSFDVAIRASGGITLCEFELRASEDGEVARFAHLAYRAMDALKRQRSLNRLLTSAVKTVRELTGFDRVMAYRFRHDDSGDVVAEDCSADMDPYVGRRYPASDIPAQARRLYVLNTLRLIADVGDVPVPLLADATHPEPLDLSHSILRSVSPIHIEYLQNMGVAASMSVSIVVGGRLWGMIACHHRQPRRVPYPIRMAVDVMAQVIASTVQSLGAQSREAVMARATLLRGELVRLAALGTDVVEAVQLHADAMHESLGCHALLTCIDGLARWNEGIDAAWAQRLVDGLKGQPEPLVHLHETGAVRTFAGNIDDTDDVPFCGVLALRFDHMRQGWIIALRREQIQTVRWGGKPDKEIAHGPLGPRLTPRGSFAEWRETVRDSAEPWSPVELDIARNLMDALSQAHAHRVLEVGQLRSQLWAMLGHDLRNPLQSLTMAASAIERGHNSDQLNAVMRNSTLRMRQLLGNVLDVSRLQHGFDLTLHHERVDLALIIGQLVEEAQVAHPATQVTVTLPAALWARVDAVRYAQVVSNMLSNARHHGHGMVEITATVEDGHAVLTVVNPSPPIPDDVAASLFDPFKRHAAGNVHNPTGMGLGLYIAHQVVAGHRGTLVYRAADGMVIFEARVPLSLDET